MVGWSFFFIAKSILYFKGNLQYDWFLNSLVGFYSILPWAVTRSVGLEIKKGTAVRVIHSAFGFPLAAMLLWHDSYLPPVKSLTKFLSDPVTRPSNDYLLQFLVSYWNPLEVILLAGILIACVVLAKKRVNLVPGAAAVFFITTAHGAIKIKQNQNDLSLQDLSLPVLVSRPIELEQPKKADQPFDIVILQVCSMSWDDLNHSKMADHPFFQEFDLFFTRFNTGTSYSTPAALRLLQGQCGQVSHQTLFQEGKNECFLMENLRKNGFKTETVFNHQGKLSVKMGEEINKFAKADLPMDFSGLTPEEINYDQAPVFGNLDVLSLWWKKRLESKNDRTAIYYNTVSLHGGNHLVNDSGKWWSRDKVETYRNLLLRTLGDFQKFFELLNKSNRDVLVIMVPEHGAALVGSDIQGPDLRDIPLPKITTVPMGVKLIGTGWRKSDPIKVEQVVSYPVIAKVLNLAIKKRSSGNLFSDSDFSDLPSIDFFAENENAATLIRGGELFYRGKDRVWKTLSDNNIPESLRTISQSRSK